MCPLFVWLSSQKGRGGGSEVTSSLSTVRLRSIVAIKLSNKWIPNWRMPTFGVLIFYVYFSVYFSFFFLFNIQCVVTRSSPLDIKGAWRICLRTTRVLNPSVSVTVHTRNKFRIIHVRNIKYVFLPTFLCSWIHSFFQQPAFVMTP